MGKTPVRVNEYFEISEDGEEFIHNPPLLAEFGNLRVELRKEKNHSTPHVHVIKNKIHDVSLRISDLKVLAGKENIPYFDRNEYRAVLEFIIENGNHFIECYEKLRGEL